MNDRLGAVVMSWQMSEHESMVRRFCERSTVWRDGHSNRACESVAKAASLTEAPRSRACCRSRCRIQLSTTRMSLVETWLPRSRAAISSSGLRSLGLRRVGRVTTAPVPLLRSWTLLSNCWDSCWTWSFFVTSSSSCLVSFTMRFFIDSSSDSLCCRASVCICARWRSELTLASYSEDSRSRWLRSCSSSCFSRSFSRATASTESAGSMAAEAGRVRPRSTPGAWGRARQNQKILNT
mmetsp:Transcript_1377/g.4248  ORF Transcript_1377/g.4248 Transcript_1377/m.4248 type:complete len:237 (+) Transcript_1377:1388-2098(+)